MIFYFVRIKNPDIAAAISLVIASHTHIILTKIFWLAYILETFEVVFTLLALSWIENALSSFVGDDYSIFCV